MLQADLNIVWRNVASFSYLYIKPDAFSLYLFVAPNHFNVLSHNRPLSALGRLLMASAKVLARARCKTQEAPSYYRLTLLCPAIDIIRGDTINRFGSLPIRLCRKLIKKIRNLKIAPLV